MDDGTSSREMAGDVLDVLVGNHRRFLAFLLPRVGSREAAEDILQAAFVKGIERGGAIREGESAVAWFYRLLRNALVDHHRRRDAESRALERYSRDVPGSDPGEIALLEDVVCACVGELIPTLSEAHARLLHRVDLGGQRVPAVARDEGISPGAAAVRLHRARAALRERLRQVCGTCTEHGCLDCTCGR